MNKYCLLIQNIHTNLNGPEAIVGGTNKPSKMKEKEKKKKKAKFVKSQTGISGETKATNVVFFFGDCFFWIVGDAIQH